MEPTRKSNVSKDDILAFLNQKFSKFEGKPNKSNKKREVKEKEKS
jgi:hypothetical protein